LHVYVDRKLTHWGCRHTEGVRRSGNWPRFKKQWGARSMPKLIEPSKTDPRPSAIFAVQGWMLQRRL